MKRLDFVSNSSSCSFFVYLPNDNAVNQFKEIFDLTKEKADITQYSTIPTYYDSNPTTIKDKDSLENKGFYLIYCGEDHWSPNIDKVEDLAYRFQQFKDIVVYNDPDAHYSSGKKLPDSIEELK